MEDGPRISQMSLAGTIEKKKTTLMQELKDLKLAVFMYGLY